MAVHDAYARVTPYELLLPSPSFAAERFPAIAAEASERGVDADNPAALAMLGATMGALAELGEEGTDPGSAYDLGGVLFFAYHAWRTDGGAALARRDCVAQLLGDGATVRRLAADANWTNRLRDRAGYVQLPQHLVWTEGVGMGDAPAGTPSGTPTAAPESIDGFFWAASADGALQASLVAGMRADRPGFAVLPVPPQPLSALPGWVEGPAREDGADFASSLPGAELEGLLGVKTQAEAFKLISLLLGVLAIREPSLQAPGGAGRGSPSRASPEPSALPFAVLEPYESSP